jgi:amino acid transporter
MDNKQFQQRLGLFDSTMLVAGTMIGSGIFIVSADIIRDVGSPGSLLLIWILTGFMTILGALSYAELAAMMPRAGGQYIYLKEAFGPLWGFLYGWSLFLVIQTGSIAAVAVAFSKFLGVIAPSLGTGEEAQIINWSGLNLVISLPLPWLKEPLIIFKRTEFAITSGQLIAVAIIAFLTLLNCRGVKEGKWIQNLFTVIKTLSLIILIILGFSIGANREVISLNFADLWAGSFSTDRFNSISELVGGAPLLVAFMVAGGAMVGSLFSADAWNNVTFTAGEIRNPSRNLPLSLIFGTGSVILLYLLVNLAYLCVLKANGNPLVSIQLKAEIEEGLAIRKEYAAEANYLSATANRLESESLFLKARVALLDKDGQTISGKRLIQDAESKLEEASTFKIKADIAKDASNSASKETNRRLNERIIRSTSELGISHARDDRVGTAVLQMIFPKYGMIAMAIAIMISTFGCVNGMILMGSRLYYAMAHDGLFFKAAGELNTRGVPAYGLVLQGAWSILLVFSGTYIELLDYVIFAALLFYALTVSGLFVLRRTKPDEIRPYKAWGYPFLPFLYILLCTIVMIDLLVVRPEYTWPGLIIVASGIPVFYFWRKRNPHTI